MLKNLLLLSGFSTFVVAVIIGFNIQHNSEISTLPATTQVRVDEIAPNFDKETLNSLKKRTAVPANLSEKSNVKSEESNSTGSVSPTPTEIPDEEIASISAQPSATITVSPISL